MARPRQLSLEADKASGVCKTCCQTLSKLAICSVLIHPDPPLSRVINAYLNPLKAADEPRHCAGRGDAALYCTVLYCIVLDCTVQGVVMLEVPGSSAKDPPWSAWRLVNHYSAVLRQ